MSSCQFKTRVRWKMLNKKRTSNLDKVYCNYGQLFFPVQCTTCRKCQQSSTDNFGFEGASAFLSFSNQLYYLRGINCFVKGTQQYSTCLYQSSGSHTLFSYSYILSILGKKNSFPGISLLNAWELLHFRYS